MQMPWLARSNAANATHSFASTIQCSITQRLNGTDLDISYWIESGSSPERPCLIWGKYAMTEMKESMDMNVEKEGKNAKEEMMATDWSENR